MTCKFLNPISLHVENGGREHNTINKNTRQEHIKQEDITSLNRIGYLPTHKERHRDKHARSNIT